MNTWRGYIFIKHGTNYNFVGKRWYAFLFSLALVAVTIAFLFWQGLNFGIDFKGGILIEAKGSTAIDVASVRQTLSPLGLNEEIQEFGAPDTVLIRVAQQPGGDAAQMAAVAKVRDTLGDNYEYRRVEVVGPRVGDELFRTGIIATLLAALAIGLYVWIRFEWQFGVSALIATVHDVFVTVGLFTVLQLDFDLTAVAALLLLAGYSINDTVVVFDRIRENLRRHKRAELSEVINIAVNETLSRTINTAGTTLVAILPLLLFGGEAMLNFSLAIFWGILVGTFSSIYVAAAILLYLPPIRHTENSGKSQAA